MTERSESITERLDLATYAMPSLGADMDEGSIIEWLVDVGDQVERGQVVARVETEKSDIDIEIWQEGIVDEIVVHPNRTVAVGTTLLRIRTISETSADSTVPPPPVGTTAEAAEAVGDAVWASPLARRLAGAQGISLASIVGTGPHGAVRARDLTGAAADPTEEQSTGAAPNRADRMRTAIAARMAQSNREIPHYRLERDIDLAALTEHLRSINDDRPVASRIVPAAAFVRAVAIAAARHSELNGTWVDDRFHPGSGVHVAVAISLRSGGLVTPIIHDADEHTLDDVMELLREFTTAARTGTLRSQWTGGDSTITVTNLGERGADLVHGLISPPEVALVGFGRVLERPWVVDWAVAPRPIVCATLGADHRATDGAVGSRFLSTLANALEKPEQL